MTGALAWAVLAPLIGAVLCVLAGRRGQRWIAGATVLATLAAASAVAWSVGARGVLRHAVGGWGPSLGIDLRADGPAAVMLLAIAGVTALTGAEALGPAGGTGAPDRPAARWLFAWAALDALVLSADLFNLYVALELVTLAAVGLIAGRGRREAGADRPLEAAAQAALRYLLVAIPGSLVYLLGVALLYGRYATLDLATLGARIAPDPASRIALALIAAGLCLKAALFPLHAWLPPAYVSARPPVSAVLAALVAKAAFYVLFRVWLEVVPAGLAPRAGWLLGILGAGGVLWGSVLALGQARLRPLIAYSSVAQLGYLFLAFALGTPRAWAAAVYLAVAHAAAKAAMFLAAGVIERAIGKGDLASLRGLAHQLPVTFFAFALAGVSLMGMPPTGGFVAKWLLIRAAFEARQGWVAAVVLAGGLFAAGYVFKVLRIAFLPAPGALRFQPPPRGAELVALALALVALGLGVAPGAPLALLQVGLAR